MIQIAAIMPCRGRAEQTVRNVRRLLATAGDVAWRLVLVCDGDQEVYNTLSMASVRDKLPGDHLVEVIGPNQSGKIPQHGYWGAMKLGAMVYPDAPLLCGLANDLLPGKDWLARAVAEYRCCFGDGDGLMGFNDGIHAFEHSPHFLISRRLLQHYGGWPVWYQHNFGDLELCTRAREDSRYGKASWAVLYHDHWLTGNKPDAVYAEGMASNDADRRLFDQRRAAGWPRVSR